MRIDQKEIRTIRKYEQTIDHRLYSIIFQLTTVETDNQTTKL